VPADLCKFALGQVVGLFEAGASSAPSGSIITSTGSNDQVHKEMVAAGASSLTNLSTERDARPGNTAVAEKSGLDKSVAKGCLDKSGKRVSNAAPYWADTYQSIFYIFPPCQSIRLIIRLTQTESPRADGGLNWASGAGCQRLEFAPCIGKH
jgi:hypothetical protein